MMNQILLTLFQIMFAWLFFFSCLLLLFFFFPETLTYSRYYICQQRTTCFKFYSFSKQIRCGIMLSEACLYNINPAFVGLRKIK